MSSRSNVTSSSSAAAAAAASSLVAWRSETDASVVLVEAGPDYGSRSSGRWPADLLDGGALVTSHDWGYASGELPGREPIDFPRARVIGGCSSHNGCVVAVGCPADYDGWAAIDRRQPLGRRRDPARARPLTRAARRSHVRRGRGRPVPSLLPRRGRGTRPAARRRPRRPRRRDRLRHRARQHRRGRQGERSIRVPRPGPRPTQPEDRRSRPLRSDRLLVRRRR